MPWIAGVAQFRATVAPFSSWLGCHERHVTPSGGFTRSPAGDPHRHRTVGHRTVARHRPHLASQCLGRALRELPEEHRPGIAEATCGTRCTLSIKALRDALREADVPRSPKSRRHPFSAMLTLICYGSLCGAPDVKTIWPQCGPPTQQQRAAIGLTWRKP